VTLALGCDLGATNLRAALVDTRPGQTAPPELSGDMKAQLPSTDPERVADVVADAVNLVCRGAGAAAATAPLGVGVAGMLRGDTGVVEQAPNLRWRAVDFRGMLAARLPGRRIVLANDVNAIAYGEYVFGAGRGVRDILCVYAGTGIGGGLVCDGVLVKGAAHMAGEIGHSKIVLGPAARLCGCGQRGCLEAYAGGAKIAERVHAELAGGLKSHAVALAGGVIEKVHAGHLDIAAREGDPYAVALWDEIAPLFGAVVANAVTLLNPARVIFGGGVLWGAAELRRRVLDWYRRLVNAPTGASCEIVEAALGDNAGILGAASLAALGGVAG
jgi:glucokinase